MSQGITVVYVPGAWHGPNIYDEVSKRVTANGFSSLYINTPSVGHVLKDPYEDSLHIRENILEELDSKGNDVVLVVHSYGGLCGANSCEGLAKKDREGKNTSVIGVVYLCAFALSKGVTLMDGIGNKPLAWFVEKGDFVETQDQDNVFYNDCTPEQKAYKSELKPHSYNTFRQPCLYEVWKDIPCTYLICELDNALLPHVQRMMIDNAGTFKDTKAIQASHSPFFSKPEETADYIVDSTNKFFK